MALNEITLAITSLKSITEIVKTILNISKDARINEEVIKLQNIILTLQSHLLSAQIDQGELIEVKSNLEKKLMEYENWDKKESQYELKELTRGIFVYAPKKDDKSTQPDHWLCTNCFKNHEERILQKHTIGPKVGYYFCPKCGMEIFPKGL